MSLPKVAVVTACYNANKYIGDCIDSVAKSNTGNDFLVEHIVVDDGSTDGTQEYLNNMAVVGTKVVLLSTNGGQSTARNIGVEKTNADYVFFLDSDDVLFENSLRHLLMAKADWVYGDFVRGDSELRYLTGLDYWGTDFKDNKEVLRAMYKGEHFFQQNCLYKREMFLKVGGFDKDLRMAEDFDLATRLLLAGYYPKYLPGPLYMHRNHGDNLSIAKGRNKESHIEDVGKFKEKYAENLRNMGVL